jgi:transcriptional regulator with XRE-family HTH domain
MMVRFADDDLPPVDDFGAWLRDARESAGISLEQIAASTKVGHSLLVALERNDVSRWPAGIFRRAFVRSYADMVGLDPDVAVAAFLRAFPDSPEADSPFARTTAIRRATCRRESSLRLTLAPEVLRWQSTLARLGAAATDLMAPITLALPSGLLGGQSLFWVVLAVVAVLYLVVGTLVLGTTPGLWMAQWVGSQPLGARRVGSRRTLDERGHEHAEDHGDESMEREVSPVHWRG